MKVICPVCHGKGTVNIPFSGLMSYYNPHTGDTVPQKICPGCGGTGVQESGE